MNKSKTNQSISKVALQKIKTFLNLTDLPVDLNISTITVTCRFDTTFNVENIGKYMKLSDKIAYIKYGDGPKSIRTLIPKKTKAKKKKKQKKAFYNQTTVGIVSSFKSKKKPTNVKLFKNGSIQMTGCVGLENCVEVLTILCDELRKVRAVLEPKKMDKVIVKPFVVNPDVIDILNVEDIKIRMINSNFRIGFKVDRDQLYQILLADNLECTYEPCVHACVNIKYYLDNKKVSIFVFESGAIIITGGKSKEQVLSAYNFITKKLFDNYEEIVKTEIDDILENNGLQELIKELE